MSTPGPHIEPTPEELRVTRERVLAAFGGRDGHAPRTWSRARERRLVRRILRSTTREDPGWRGDARLFVGFVHRRLRDSRTLRWVAASLLVHAVALPVCAYLAGGDPPRRGAFTTGIEPGPPLPFAPEADEGRELAELTPPPRASLDADGSAPTAARERVHNVLQRDRFVLQQDGTLPVVTATAGAPLEMKLLAARSPGAAVRGEPQGWLDDETAFAEADDLERVLWTEVLLDRFVSSRERSPLLGRALHALHASQRGRTDATGWLEHAAATRARAYGLWEAQPGFEPEAVPLPLSATWREHLARAWEANEPGVALPPAWGPPASPND